MAQFTFNTQIDMDVVCEKCGEVLLDSWDEYDMDDRLEIPLCEECKEEAYDEGYDAGKSSGYDEGYDEGYESGKAAVKAAHEEGYNEGYQVAREEAEREGREPWAVRPI